MNDRELLAAAARANGVKWKWMTCPRWQGEVPGLYSVDSVNNVGYYAGWNPLEDDGDALRLAVKLRLDVHFEMNGPGMATPIVEAMDAAAYRQFGSAQCPMEDCTADPYAATRRAIVRAAASLGERGKG